MAVDAQGVSVERLFRSRFCRRNMLSDFKCRREDNAMIVVCQSVSKSCRDPTSTAFVLPMQTH